MSLYPRYKPATSPETFPASSFERRGNVSSDVNVERIAVHLSWDGSVKRITVYLVQVGQNMVREDLSSVCVAGELQAHRAVLGGLFHLARPRRGTMLPGIHKAYGLGCTIGLIVFESYGAPLCHRMQPQWSGLTVRVILACFFRLGSR